MGLFRKAIQDDFMIVAISPGLTMDMDNNAVMVAAIQRSRPSHWEMMNPDGYTAYFRSRESDSRGRAKSLVSQVQDFIIRDQRFAEFKVGLSEGCLVAEINWRGRICFPPMGGAVNDAFKSQKGKIELQINTSGPICAKPPQVQRER